MGTMKKIVNQKKCTGCYACVNICPKDAIAIKRNNTESNEVVINNKCINCHLCECVCPSINPVSMKKARFCYAAWSKDNRDLMESSSGGIAAVLSRAFLRDSGIVYGSVSKNKKVFHERVESISKCDELRGSKYVESSIGFCYRRVKQDLRNNKKVLFIGTPCQVAGLKRFLGKEYDDLLTVDLICHGTPPFDYLEKYINSILSKKQRGEWDRVSFRNNKYEFSIMAREKVLYKQVASLDAYFSAFLSGLILRQSCYSCKFAAMERVGDITIGDFWGLDRKKLPYDYLGKVSVVLPNTAKGETVMVGLSNELVMVELPVEDAYHSDQGNLLHPSIPHVDREKFLDLLPQIGIKKAIMATTVGDKIKELEKIERRKLWNEKKDNFIHFPNRALKKMLGNDNYSFLKRILRG